MRVAAGQFAVTPVWRTNAQTCVAMMQQAAREGAALLVLPEALLARDDNDPDMSVKSVSVRGLGKFRYKGTSAVTKKGRLMASVEVFV